MDYSADVQRAVTYIGAHLEGRLTPGLVAQEVGLSRFHFSRVFQKETGEPPSAYIRGRRLAAAAARLVDSDAPILDVALRYRFGSQEAFTRAFKQVYALPPGGYRKLVRGLIQKKGERTMGGKEEIKGWFMTGTAAQDYQVAVDSKISSGRGNRSVRLESRAPGVAEGYGTLMQQLRAESYRGRRMKFSGFLRTEEVVELAAFWFRVDGSLSKGILALDNMQDRPVKGTTDWNYYSLVLDIPDNAASVLFGVLLQGPGKVWADGTSLEEVDRSVPTTEIDFAAGLPDEPVNLDFSA